jgi:hypothetical protein
MRTAVAAFTFLTLSFNALAAPLTAQLTPSNYNGYNISCFGGSDGSIDLTVTGGTPPYTYYWSNSLISEDISNLSANYYSVDVYDSNNQKVSAAITLSEPPGIDLTGSLNEYPNGFHISCYQCFNGVVALNVTGGVPPYTFLWDDGNPSQVHYSMGSGSYSVLLTDNNGCTKSSEHFYLTEPPKSNWAMDGNSGSNPPTEFVGTSDNKDLVFKTNNTERLRIKNNGLTEFKNLLKIDTASTDSSRTLYVDQDGILRALPVLADEQSTLIQTSHCIQATNRWYSNYCALANNIYTWSNVGIGTTTPVAKFNVVGTSVFNGIVGIGMTPGSGTTSKLQVDGTIACREVKVTQGSFPDFVFESGYNLRSLSDVENYIKLHGHLPEIPSSVEVAANNGFEVGAMQEKLLQKIEELTLYIIEQNKKIEELQNVVKNKK